MTKIFARDRIFASGGSVLNRTQISICMNMHTCMLHMCIVHACGYREGMVKRGGMAKFFWWWHVETQGKRMEEEEEEVY